MGLQLVVAAELERLGDVARVGCPGNRDLVPSAGAPGEARVLPPAPEVRDGDLSHRAGDVLALLLDLHVDIALHGHLHRAHAWEVSDGFHRVVVPGAGAIIDDGRRDASFLEIDATANGIEIRRRLAGGGSETLFSGP